LSLPSLQNSNLNNNTTSSSAITVSQDSPSRTRSINLSLAIYVTAKKAKDKALNNSNNKRFKLKGDIITDLSNDSEPDFDDSENNVFDPIIRDDYNI
jgi:hypothetical protein